MAMLAHCQYLERHSQDVRAYRPELDQGGSVSIGLRIVSSDNAEESMDVMPFSRFRKRFVEWIAVHE